MDPNKSTQGTTTAATRRTIKVRKLDKLETTMVRQGDSEY